MKDQEKKQNSVKLRGVFTLRCPYCCETALQKKGSWFKFQEGCSKCQLLFEREEGYFLGAAWMINYPLIGVTLMLIGAGLFMLFPEGTPMQYASALSVAAVVGGLLFFPFGRSIWMYFDHLLHPMTEEDREKYLKHSLSD